MSRTRKGVPLSLRKELQIRYIGGTSTDWSMLTNFQRIIKLFKTLYNLFKAILFPVKISLQNVLISGTQL